ncbi:hypothetical protein PV327_004052 [Microctonus hyperodae]|uniref:Uncharacterized protein n=1 Tax=Microctonus hyperodae TaxID=165561 RepID=A0AA39FBR0_MICHY|nr:hypothetical protein PV327_004052 [Microctonus hyperodae]
MCDYDCQDEILGYHEDREVLFDVCSKLNSAIPHVKLEKMIVGNSKIKEYKARNPIIEPKLQRLNAESLKLGKLRFINNEISHGIIARDVIGSQFGTNIKMLHKMQDVSEAQDFQDEFVVFDSDYEMPENIRAELQSIKSPVKVEKTHIRENINMEINGNMHKSNSETLDRNLSKFCKENKGYHVCLNKWVLKWEIRGKLMRTVPILLNKLMRKSIDMILKWRKKAKVPSTNPYVFGITGPDDETTLSATKLMRDFSNLCGAENPTTLRGTPLRKHLATKCAANRLDNKVISPVAKFMGHHVNVHNNIYVRPEVKVDIVDTSRILENFQTTNPSTQYMNTTMNSSLNTTVSEINPNDSIISSTNTTFTIPSEGNQENDATSQSIISLLHHDDTDRTIDCLSLDENDNTASAKSKKIVRRRWTNEELIIVNRLFRSHIEDMSLPSLPCIRKLQQEHSVLQSRSADVIKTWMSPYYCEHTSGDRPHERSYYNN